MKLLFWLVLVASLVGYSSGCSVNGLRIDHVNTEPKGQVEDFTSTVPPKDSTKEKPPKKPSGKYSNDRDWPAKWERWHRYYQTMTCELNDYTTCALYICGDTSGSAPSYAGKFINHSKKIIYKYYVTQCFLTQQKGLTEKSSGEIDQQTAKQ